MSLRADVPKVGGTEKGLIVRAKEVSMTTLQVATIKGTITQI